MAENVPQVDDLENTLRLTADRLSELMDELDRLSDAGPVRRDHARLEYRKHAVEIEVYQPSGGSVQFCVACRNLSRGGMSVLHSSYMHIGTRCRIRLRHKIQGDQWIVGEVVQCRHVAGRAHDVGLRFMREIDVNDFVRLDPLDESFSLEYVDPSELRGRALLVTANEIEKKLIEVYLGDTAMRLVRVDNYAEVAQLLTQHFDVVLYDFDMDPREAKEHLKEVRASGNVVPVIAMSGDTSVDARDRIREARASAFIPKPVVKESLHRALAEYILLNRTSDGQNEPETVSTPVDPALKGLAELFAKDLKRFAMDIENHLKDGNEKELRYICARIRGTGPLLGHGAIADAAGKVLTQLDEHGSIAAAQEAINILMGLCRHAKPAA